MKIPSGAPSRARHIACPFCESGKLVPLGHGFARCGSCGLPLVGSIWETLRDIIALPDTLGAHPCECGHPEMRLLPDGMFHCPACGSEVFPMEIEAAGETFGPDIKTPSHPDSQVGGRQKDDDRENAA